MAQIQRKWIADNAVNNDKLDNDATYNMRALGIGDTTNGIPIDHLHIQKPFDAGITLQSTATYGRPYRILTDATSNFLIQDTTNGNNRVFIDPTGRVGFDQTPRDRLDIYSDVEAVGIRLDTDVLSGKDYRIRSATDGRLVISDMDAVTERIAINPSTGITTIAESLSVNVDATVGNDLLVTRDATVSGSIYMGSGASITEFDTDTNLAADSDAIVPTQKAIKTYVDNAVAGENLWDRSGTLLVSHIPGDSVRVDTDLYVNRDATVARDATVGNDLHIGGDATIIGVLGLQGDVRLLSGVNLAQQAYYFANGYINDIYTNELRSLTDPRVTVVGDFKVNQDATIGVDLQVDRDATIAGTLNISQYLRHIGDTDTYVEFKTNTIDVYAGSIKNITAGSAITVVNEDLADHDFRIRGTTDNNNLYSDAGNNRIGIGTSSPTTKLTVSGDASAHDLYIENSVVHSGDTNTYMEFTTNQQDFYAGSLKMLTLSESTLDGVYVNYDQDNIDFVVRSQASLNSLWVDGATGYVGIDTNTPTTKLDVVGDLNISRDATIGRDATIVGRLYMGSGASITEFNTSTSLGTSDLLIPTQNAVKQYVDSAISVENLWDRAGTILSPHTSGDSVSTTGDGTFNGIRLTGSRGDIDTPNYDIYTASNVTRFQSASVNDLYLRSGRDMTFEGNFSSSIIRNNADMLPGALGLPLSRNANLGSSGDRFDTIYADTFNGNALTVNGTSSLRDTTIAGSYNLDVKRISNTADANSIIFNDSVDIGGSGTSPTRKLNISSSTAAYGIYTSISGSGKGILSSADTTAGQFSGGEVAGYFSSANNCVIGYGTSAPSNLFRGINSFSGTVFNVNRDGTVNLHAIIGYSPFHVSTMLPEDVLNTALGSATEIFGSVYGNAFYVNTSINAIGGGENIGISGTRFGTGYFRKLDASTSGTSKQVAINGFAYATPNLQGAITGNSIDGTGVYGGSTNDVGVSGLSLNGTGVNGFSVNSTGIVGSSVSGVAGSFSGGGTAVLQVQSTTNWGVYSFTDSGHAVHALANTTGIAGWFKSTGGIAVDAETNASTSYAVKGKATNSSSYGIYGENFNGTGTFGIGYNTGVAAQAYVDGANAYEGYNQLGGLVFKVDSSGQIYSNTAGGISSPADFAEWSRVQEDYQTYEEGDIVQQSETEDLTVTLATNNENVYGTITNRAAFCGGLPNAKKDHMSLTDAELAEKYNAKKIALIGHVLCKVKGKIKRGERLVLSEEPGIARAAINREEKLFSFGIAREPYDSEETGKIEIKLK